MCSHVCSVFCWLTGDAFLMYCGVVSLRLHLPCFDVCWSFGVAGLGWYRCSRPKHNWSVRVKCGSWGFMAVWIEGLFLLVFAQEWVCFRGRAIKSAKHRNASPHNRCGIYQLTCNKYHLPYVGQTNRSLSVRIQEHIRYIRNNSPQSAYAEHILQNQHEYCQMNNIMTLLKPLNYPSLTISYEQYYIQSLHQEGKLILEQIPGEIIPLFKRPWTPSSRTPHEQTSCASACYMDTNRTQPHRNSNTLRNNVGANANSQH